MAGSKHSKKEDDLGLGKTAGGKQRTINPDGSYNITRITGRFLGNFFLYHWLITTSWRKYFASVLTFYVIMNILFATVYFMIGVEELNGMQYGSWFKQWLYCFFFSAQSFTTVGYGGIHPVGELANLVAVSEAFTGLLTFALATGTLYGRFSRPRSKIRYSPNMLIAPYEGGTGMMFMVANELDGTLVEMSVRVTIGWNEKEENGAIVRRFEAAELEVDKIPMFPTSWVINHPIDEKSFLWKKTYDDLQKLDVEVFILLKGFDDVFAQTIYSRHSYMADQFVFNAKFIRPFHVDGNGKTVMDLTKVGVYELVS